MAIGGFIEPFVVIGLLVGGVLVNQRAPKRDYYPIGHRWRSRNIGMFGLKRAIRTPDTSAFASRWLSRVVDRFPFLLEVLYWALIYWVYQLGRAASALFIGQHTRAIALSHARVLVDLEKSMHLFIEPSIQQVFLRHELLLAYINRVYSYIHIPGSILFLLSLYYYCHKAHASTHMASFYRTKRRAMATCNLIAFVIFTTWPCAPPRMLDMFQDTVHTSDTKSVWTDNRFVNHYAAMPSLHFGYSLLIGWTICALPVTHYRRIPQYIIGVAYPSLILTAIIATGNHFILDAVAGAIVCGMGIVSNKVMLNLLPLEDCLFWCMRVHKARQSSPPGSPLIAKAEGPFIV